jgi:hypothetical protein
MELVSFVLVIQTSGLQSSLVGRSLALGFGSCIALSQSSCHHQLNTAASNTASSTGLVVGDRLHTWARGSTLELGCFDFFDVANDFLAMRLDFFLGLPLSPIEHVPTNP